MASPRITVGSTFDAKGIEQAQKSLKKFADESKTGMERFQDSMQRASKTMGDVGAKLTKSITLPLAGVGVAAVKTATEFESSMTMIQSLVGFSAEAVAEMNGQVLEMAGRTAKAPGELADALFFATSAGLDAAAAIDAVEQAARASAVGLGEVSTIVDLTTSVMNAYGAETMNATKATDLLTTAVRLGKLEPSQLAGSMGQVLPIASAMGVQFEEVAGAFAAMSRTGTTAGSAASQLKGILSAILKPTSEAQRAFADVGLTTEGLHRSLREDGLLATLELLVAKFDGNAAATSAVFGNVEALSGVMDMLGGNADATREVFEGMNDAAGATADAFAIASETAEFKFRQSLADLQTTLIEVGNVLLPIVSDVAEGIGKLVSKFSELDEGTQRALVYFGGFVALIGPVVSIAGKVAGGIGAMARAFVILRTAMMAHPILAAATVITLIATALIGFSGKAKEARARTDEFAESLRTLGREQTLQNSLVDLVKANDDLAEVLAKSTLSLRDIEKAIKDGSAGTEEFQMRIEDAANEAGIFDTQRIMPLTESIESLNNTYGDAIEKNANLSAALVGTMEGLELLNQTFIEADRQAGITGQAILDVADDAAEMTTSVQMSYSTLATASEATMVRVTDAAFKGAESFTKANQKMLESGEDFVNGLVTQRIQLEKWGEDLAIIAFTTSVEFAEHIAEMGSAGYQLAADLADDLSLLGIAFEEWQGVTEATSNAAALAVTAARLSMASDMALMESMLSDMGGMGKMPVPDPNFQPPAPPPWSSQYQPFNPAPSSFMPFRDGGLVPGPPARPMPILAHGGEYVLSEDVVDAIRGGGPSRGIDPIQPVQSGPSVVIENYTAVTRTDDEMLVGMLEFAVRGGRL